MTDRLYADRELDALDEQLAIYGPDLKRWPVASQQRFVTLLANNAEAQRLMVDAVNLERLVLEPPPVSPARFAAVRDGVLSAAKRERDSGLMAAALPLTRPREQHATRTRDPHSVNSIPPGGRKAGAGLLSGWSPFALAASLILGLAAGGLGLADQMNNPDPVVAARPVDEGTADEGTWAFAANTSDEEDSL